MTALAHISGRSLIEVGEAVRRYYEGALPQKLTLVKAETEKVLRSTPAAAVPVTASEATPARAEAARRLRNR